MIQQIKKNYFYIFLIMFLIITYLVVNNKIFSFDEAIYNFSQIFYSNITTKIVKIITFLGSAMFLVPCVIIVFLKLKDKHQQLFFIITMIFEEICNLLLKNIIKRPRPAFLHLVTEKSFSFPSGHAMGSMAFYGLLIYFLWHSKINKKMKIIYASLLIILLILISFSRIYLGVHFASDIIAGLCFSIFLIGLVNRYFN